ncbi:serine/threonine protein kinase [Thiohalocapsa marina]|uniref:non-specific serine/threonine protein kinase n=1 Tax=Thiohalocapsa marina TaxID=424902 RepID=A0A5M8FVV6_9GAMM|nr:serine/threonine-protein kinase [Thiohalocapsa marina]KAA6187936.1 serine/threonine protein kinase [Thiohalocapsa marina]
MADPNFNHLCPGCFVDKGAKHPCPHCGYDEFAARGPLVLPHRTLLNGQFLIGRVLGKPGGFGITYLGWDLQLQTSVAIKEYLPRDLAGRGTDQSRVAAHSGEDAELFRFGLEQFLREARTLAQLDHPNIVRVRQFFEANGTAYLVMDYYDGLSLEEYLDKQGGRLSEDSAIRLMMPILDGLRAVHAKGFLHRDLKPQNIYLAKTDTGGLRPILLDFGAARQAMGERSRSLSVVVSAGYAPFEQYHRKGKQGSWTDVYSAAAVLYRMVTGEIPPDSAERVAQDELKPATAYGVTHWLNDALMQALRISPDERPQKVEAFQAHIRFSAQNPSIPESSESMAFDAGNDKSDSESDFSTAGNTSATHFGYIPVSKFSRITDLSEREIIEKIRDGSFDGKLLGREWHISEEELPGSKDIGRETENDNDYIPVAELSGLVGMPEEVIICDIRDGKYDGLLIDGEWYIYKDDLLDIHSPLPRNDSIWSKREWIMQLSGFVGISILAILFLKVVLGVGLP